MKKFLKFDSIEQANEFKDSMIGSELTTYILNIDGHIQLFNTNKKANYDINEYFDYNENSIVKDQEFINYLADYKLFGDNFDYNNISEEDLHNLTTLGNGLNSVINGRTLDNSKYKVSDLSCLEYTTIYDIAGINESKEFKNLFGAVDLLKIVLPETITEIGTCAFAFCMSLTDVTLPNTVESIRTKAFFNCTSLQEITIPENVTIIEQNVFNKCKSLEKIIIKSRTPFKVYKDTFNGIGENCKIYVPRRCVKAFKEKWIYASDLIYSL